ncbi:diaminopimelate epimerase [Pelagirhabdus alkalitolerans]|uniref:Diaminopimelate epimerase n=1 Tax=Pelagirhabdus alkalitolerans TaxID=1612202 RepID=A0A1G6LTP1_9BACI|nr:diaminopimelate epimerase [Pelagirhabdus alkalitolerans]SDC46464.1 diaminopimelate epimerase [Pelagirhabdus alkalitolerans]
MRIPFTKMHGLGNSYIYINLFNVTLKEEELSDLAKELSNPNTGIGSDGMILITPSQSSDVGMRIFNKDGSEGKTCGNGLRCVAKYVFENEMVKTSIFQIETKAGNVTAEVHGTTDYVESVTVDMGVPHLERQSIPMQGPASDSVISEPFDVNGDTLQLTAVSMGNPHAVMFVDDINQAPLYELGPVMTKDSRFSEGVNVEFVEIINKTEMHFRVWERGSGVTQACGTGACAATVAAILNEYAERDQLITVHLAGGDLFIKWSSDGHVWMTGAAVTTVEGYYNKD